MKPGCVSLMAVEEGLGRDAIERVSGVYMFELPSGARVRTKQWYMALCSIDSAVQVRVCVHVAIEIVARRTHSEPRFVKTNRDVCMHAWLDS